MIIIIVCLLLLTVNKFADEMIRSNSEIVNFNAYAVTYLVSLIVFCIFTANKLRKINRERIDHV